MATKLTVWGLQLLALSSVVVLSQLPSVYTAPECSLSASYVHGGNVGALAECSHLRGNLVLSQLSLQGSSSYPPLNISNLSVLSDLEEIDGYLQIQDIDDEDFANLRFLRNLHTIRGNQTVEVFTRDYAVHIESNEYLHTLNLASLRLIVNGGVRINQNPRLCLVDTVMSSLGDYLMNENDFLRIGGLGTAEVCNGVRCHSECEGNSGCWGTLADECIVCRHYDYLDTCVPSCNLSVSYPNETLGTCVPLSSLQLPPSTSHTITILPNPTPPLIPPALPAPSRPCVLSTAGCFTTWPDSVTIQPTASSPPHSSMEWNLALSIGTGTGLGVLITAVVIVIIVVTVSIGYRNRASKKKRQLNSTGTENVCLIRVSVPPHSNSPPLPLPHSQPHSPSVAGIAEHRPSLSSTGTNHCQLQSPWQQHQSPWQHTRSNSVDQGYESRTTSCDSNYQDNRYFTIGHRDHMSHTGRHVSSRMTSHGDHMTSYSGRITQTTDHMTSGTQTTRHSSIHSTRTLHSVHPPHYPHRGRRTRNFTDPHTN